MYTTGIITGSPWQRRETPFRRTSTAYPKEGHEKMKRDTTRRAIIAGLAAGPAAALPAIAGAAPDADPILSALKEVEFLERAFNRASSKLAQMESDAEDRLGHSRPTELIVWRDYFIGGHEIELRRQALLAARGLDPAKIEQEYIDAKKRERAAIHLGRQWDERAGVADLVSSVSDLRERLMDSKRRLASTKPTTAKGAAALIRFLYRELRDEATRSHMRIFKNLASALEQWEARA
ncbi:hypothetical protein [Methylocystis rosea]|uniref:Uncharacterized protein n=1 Tax=Methylocystis rosea TaxID=173366 RepID=A0A3G8M3U3_9HYPH|nr:hypothetical protein [Methylocystis rosea]AZG75975.1 hypothetical protein EHO51_04075 [Methylocystis rosea]